ncbi:MAG: class I SAM-dependent methyltransferase [Solirubrobacterales bacterium]|nr:class I SAM-dependent methyltransferase [Solirubrobacterales bacterium]
MFRFYDHVIQPVVEALAPKRVIEVGVQYGDQTAKLLEQVDKTGGVVHAVDPLPEFDVAEWEAKWGATLVFHRALSLAVLSEVHGLDLALLDGDHNYYTVTNELRVIEETAAADGVAPPVIVLHDVDFPYGRRDLYYDPENIPAEHRQPYLQLGIDFTTGDLHPDGINNHLTHAVDHDTPRNGVRTGIEDYLASSAVQWNQTWIPGFHGLGILTPVQTLERSPALRQVIEGFSQPAFMDRWTRHLEASRVGELGHTVQRQVADLKAEHNAKLESLTAQINELETLRQALLDAEARAATLPELQLAVSDAQRQIRDEHAAAEHAREDARQTRAELIDTRGQLVALMASPSWRVTKPLRLAKRLAKRI